MSAERIWIQTAWTVEEGSENEPWLIAAYDEWTFESWGSEPDFYKADIQKGRGDQVREVRLIVSADQIRNLFSSQLIAAEVEP